MEFTSAEIRLATRNFDVEHLVGEGGFGRVYYATLRHTPAAIKILNKVVTVNGIFSYTIINKVKI